MTSPAPDPLLPQAVLEALPVSVVVVDAASRVLHANRAAREALRVAPGAVLGEALGCSEASPGPCAGGPRCAGCAVRAAVERALAGESARTRGFLFRTGAGGGPEDLHLLATAAPLVRGGERGAIVLLEDADRLLLDPAIIRICAGCGSVEDEEGAWHPLHRYLEDGLGLALEELCEGCARAADGA